MDSHEIERQNGVDLELVVRLVVGAELRSLPDVHHGRVRLVGGQDLVEDPVRFHRCPRDHRFLGMAGVAVVVHLDAVRHNAVNSLPTS
ncbi:hypothetical protein [Streptoalloteichus hindustanus]|uniref:hypothetical protein n=1 Tax=Streptoalloteichus hindustanus TaxID=2017 RepID=UPI000936047B|nr:hypothetical protein [Streptoalloteichus hindustanus]